MAELKALKQELIKKLDHLPNERIAEVEDFVDFLLSRGKNPLLTRAAAKLSEPSFQKVWDNPEDAEYDKL